MSGLKASVGPPAETEEVGGGGGTDHPLTVGGLPPRDLGGVVVCRMAWHNLA